MISVEQWRVAIGCFQPKCSVKSIVTYNEGLNVFYGMLYCFCLFVFENVKLYSSCIASMLYVAGRNFVVDWHIFPVVCYANFTISK